MPSNVKLQKQKQQTQKTMVAIQITHRKFNNTEFKQAHKRLWLKKTEIKWVIDWLPVVGECNQSLVSASQVEQLKTEAVP